MEIVVHSESELVRNAAEWIAAFARDRTGSTLPISQVAKAGTRRVLAAVGDDPDLAGLRAAGLALDPGVGPEGFVLQRMTDPAGGEVLVCWSPGRARLPLRADRDPALAAGRRPVGHDRTWAAWSSGPQFPMRICYVNFAEHLQNAFNPNVLFDVPVNRWSRADWERFIDMISAFRYNVFEFWLVPTLFSPEALTRRQDPGRVRRDDEPRHRLWQDAAAWRCIRSRR